MRNYGVFSEKLERGEELRKSSVPFWTAITRAVRSGISSFCLGEVDETSWSIRNINVQSNSGIYNYFVVVSIRKINGASSSVRAAVVFDERKRKWKSLQIQIQKPKGFVPGWDNNTNDKRRFKIFIPFYKNRNDRLVYFLLKVISIGMYRRRAISSTIHFLKD